jgi:hypothetical protein
MRGYPRGERRLKNWTPLTPIEKKGERQRRDPVGLRMYVS